MYNVLVVGVARGGRGKAGGWLRKRVLKTHPHTPNPDDS